MPRPGVVVLAVIACAVGGATANRCLTCGPGVVAALPLVQGRPLDAPPEPPAAEPAPAREAPAPQEAAPGVLAVGFDLLASFSYEHPDSPARAADPFPANVRALDRKQVAVMGYMFPLGSGEKIDRFLLVRYPFGCCFGVTPRVNEWIDVTTREPVDYVPHVPITVLGELDVGEDLENEAVMSLYRIAATAVELPLVYR